MAGIFAMKTTLAIDTATARTQFAILKGDELLWQETEDGATTHGDVLAKFGALAAKENIDQVIVGMGPGPFTGLRTGIVFAQSFAFAQGLPVHGICSLDAIAYGIELPEFIVATDARRKELYWAKYVDGKRVGEPLVTAPSEIPTLPLFGEGALKYELTTDTEHLYPKLISFPKLIHVNEPMYLRHPDAVPTAERK
jgi:tRNA threonylcarbamoyl adenosine modification protein YeaZ